MLRFELSEIMREARSLVRVLSIKTFTTLIFGFHVVTQWYECDSIFQYEIVSYVVSLNKPYQHIMPDQEKQSEALLNS